MIMLVAVGGGTTLSAFGVDVLMGTFRIQHVLAFTGMLSIVAPIVAFTVLLQHRDLRSADRSRVRAYVWVFLSSAVFWMLYVQTGTVLSGFAAGSTDRTVGSLTIPAGWFQSLGPVFIIAFAPVFASLWVWLARRNKEPSLAAKFGLGLILLAGGFVIMAGAAGMIQKGGQAAPWWLIATYLIHTFGELCLSPVGLSSVTKLAPPRFVGQLMGTWFLGSSLGNLLAGILAGTIKLDAAHPRPAEFLSLLWMPLIAGAALLCAAPWIRKLSGGVK
jgi:POT family proton-dependent oligopeptide transporter